MDRELKILLVEDNPSDLRLIEIYLKEFSLRLIKIGKTTSLSEALEELNKEQYDIILLDLTLPDSIGLDTFISLHSRVFETPIIVLTGIEDETIALATLKLGAQDFLIKGKIDAKILYRSINYSIERSKLLESIAETAKTLAEYSENLSREKQKLAQAQKLAHLGSWELDIKENSFHYSNEMSFILGLKENDKIATFNDFLGFFHPDDREYGSNIIQRSIMENSPFEFVHRVVVANGIIKTLLAKGELVLDTNGDVVRVIGTNQDITRRIREEEFEKIAMAVIKSFNAVTIADKDGKIEWVNEGFTKLTGYRIDEVRNTYGEILRKGRNTGLYPNSKYFKILFQDKKPVSYENNNFAKDGTEYWVLTSLTPLLNQKGEIEKIVSIDSDITRQKIAERELKISNKIAKQSLREGKKALMELNLAKQQLEESLKIREQFMANMSHEIRTPMNAIIGFSNLLLKENFTEEIRQYVNAIRTSSENLLVIINDILDFSKLKSGKITIENIDFNIRELITMVTEMMLPKAVEKGVQFSWVIDRNVQENLIGDPTRLNQILINLVNNAIKFTNEGSVRISVSIIEDTDEYSVLQFSITDTGIGISDENRRMIFEDFTQASSETTRKYGGTGLGLAITKQLVELQNGNIDVQSKVNEGSTFTVQLKFSKPENPGNRIPIKSNDRYDSKLLVGLKVLVVEDNFFNQALVVRILENSRCKVDVADNGIVAVEKIEKNIYDVVLMDIQLPEMDGYKATEHIRTKLPEGKKEIPIIAMTAHAFREEVEKCLKCGMNDYISKPFKENELYDKLIKNSANYQAKQK